MNFMLGLINRPSQDPLMGGNEGTPPKAVLLGRTYATWKSQCRLSCAIRRRLPGAKGA